MFETNYYTYAKVCYIKIKTELKQVSCLSEPR